MKSDGTGSAAVAGVPPGPAGSGPGCLLEQTLDGGRPLVLGNGERRGYLEDGDQVTLRAHCARQGFVSIGFGENRGEILPAR